MQHFNIAVSIINYFKGFIGMYLSCWWHNQDIRIWSNKFWLHSFKKSNSLKKVGNTEVLLVHQKPHHHYLRKNMMALTANMKKPSLKVFSIVLLLSLSAFLSSIYSTCFSLANYTYYCMLNCSLSSNSKPYPNDFLQIIAMLRWEK